MENWIEATTEPQKLILAWQAPEHLEVRFRWAVAIIQPNGPSCVLRYLTHGQEFENLNQGRSFEELTALGYVGHPAFNIRRPEHSDDVTGILLRRLPPRSRADFQAYKQLFRLSDKIELSDFALLGRTEAKLPSDGFSLVDPLNSIVDCCDLMLEIAGYRYYSAELPFVVNVGDEVDILPEPDNKHDPKAVKICANGFKIGNINRLQASTFLSWLQSRRIAAVVERLNGKPDRPKAFIFVRVRPMEQRVAA